MDIEQLKLVIDLISKIGADSKEIFIYYVLIDKIPDMLGSAAMIGALYVFLFKAYSIINALTFQAKIEEVLGVSYMTDEVKRKILQILSNGTWR